MIHSVEFTNFKSFLHQKIDLERLTVFVGPNGSGKTSVLEGIELSTHLNWTINPSMHCDWLCSRAGNGHVSVVCEADEASYQMVAQLQSTSKKDLGQRDWKIDSRVVEKVPKETFFEAWWTYLRFNAAQLARPSYSDKTIPQIATDGGGLASVLAHMALNDPDAFRELVDEMRRLIPHLTRLRFHKLPIQRTEKELVRFGDETVERAITREYLGDALLFDFANATNIAAHSVSEGTLILLGLLTVLLGPSRPDVLLLDDLDQGLHPLAQRSLLGVIRRILQRFPDLQIIATSHSPYLLDSLQPEEVRLTTINDDGYSVCGKLSDHPQFEKWKDEMAPGELWSMFGEKWLTEGSSSP